MKRIMTGLLILLLPLVFAGCPSPGGSSASGTEYSKLVVVNDTDYTGLSVYMRAPGTSDWGPNLLYQCYDDGRIPAHSSCVIENIEFGTYDLHAYIFGNFYRYNVTFDNEAGMEWGFY